MQVCRVFIHSFIHARILFSTTRFSSLHHRNFSNFSPFPMNSPVAKCFQSEAAISSVEVTQEIYHTTNKEKPKTWNFFHLMLLLYLTFTLLWFLYTLFLHFHHFYTFLSFQHVWNAYAYVMLAIWIVGKKSGSGMFIWIRRIFSIRLCYSSDSNTNTVRAFK